MTKGDLLFCYTCKAISHDVNILNMQDGRINSHWNYRCGYCYGFRTINASQFLEEEKKVEYGQIGKSKNLPALRKWAKKLKAKGLIKGFYIETRRPINVLYEKRYLHREILQAFKRHNVKLNAKGKL